MFEGLIVKGVGGLYTVDCVEGIFMCKPRGIFRKNKISPLVGDRVLIKSIGEREGIIEVIQERRTMLVRPKIANVTQALMVFSYKEPDLHLDLLDRFIVNCEAAGIKPIICFNKIDLICSNDQDFKNIKNMYEQCNYPVLALSANTGEGAEQLKEALCNEITVLAGPSGAGKSSLFNIISDSHFMETGKLSKKIQRGRHTTRHTRLVKVDDNSFLADSPGFSSVFLEGVNSSNLKSFFREFKEYDDLCRFLNCNHIDEPDCAVKKKMEEGIINRIRYNRYLSFFKEISNK